MHRHVKIIALRMRTFFTCVDNSSIVPTNVFIYQIVPWSPMLELNDSFVSDECPVNRYADYFCRSGHVLLSNHPEIPSVRVRKCADKENYKRLKEAISSWDCTMTLLADTSVRELFVIELFFNTCDKKLISI
uniref:Uncharacterized protein n=1 Tax=Acrobeloides nanus TaxID=290746 RepID=A0A914BZE2_9BILA